MAENAQTPIYDMSFCMLVAWQAHSLSNAGSKGSNRLLPRRQLLADKTETDACSGSIAKHHHAALAAEYFAAPHSALPAVSATGGGRPLYLIDPITGSFLSSASCRNVPSATPMGFS